jgi:hypothetical protein
MAAASHHPVDANIVRSPHLSVATSKPERHLVPVFVFTAAFFAYNALGIFDAPWMVPNAYDKSLCWGLFLTGLAGLGCGALIGKVVVRIRPRRTRAHPRTSKQLSFVFLVLFLGCIGFAVVSSGGIPLFQGETRFGNSALISNLAPFYGFWVLVRMISDTEQGRHINPFPALLYMVGVVILGYRSPVLSFVLTWTCYLIFFRFSRRRAIWAGLGIGLAMLAFAASIALFRVSQNYDAIRFFANIDARFIADHPYALPLIPALSMFDFSQYTISMLGQALHQPMYGELLFSNFETLLPGKHWGARNIVGSLTGARWVAGRPMSITPTLQGALFVDFREIGVFAGFLVLAVAIRASHALAISGSALARFGFCALFAMTLMAIHAGYWDVNILFVGVFVLALKLFDRLKSFSRATATASKAS